MTTIEINGRVYEWRKNFDHDKWSCHMCEGFVHSEVCAAADCSEMPPFHYLALLAKPSISLNTPSEARKEAAQVW